MKKHLFCIFNFLFIFCLTSPVVAGQIQGTVTNLEDVSIQDIQVTAYTPSGFFGSFSGVANATTDSDGHFEIAGLSSGEYRVGFYDPSGQYARQFYNGKTIVGQADDINVEDGQVTTGIDANLALAGNIQGMVTNVDGEALQDVYVYVYECHDSGCAWIDYADTDAQGKYDIGGLNAGNYRVEFRDNSEQYISQYYNGKTDLEYADAVEVKAGKTTTGIDANLALAGRIQGTVTGQTGDFLGGIEVTVYGLTYFFGSYTWMSVAKVTTNSNEDFEIAGLSSGEYRVGFYDPSGQYASQFYNGKTTVEQADDINVEDEQITTGIDANLVKTSLLPGVLMLLLDDE